jgi:L-ascorbate metabolism protein UlaG (beta-lactamase superfamily)
MIKPKVVIPMHYGAIVGSADDAKRFSEALQGTCEVVVLGG